MADTTRFPIDLTTPGVATNAGNSFFNVTSLAAATPDFELGHWEFIVNVDGHVNGYVTIPNTIGATPAAKIILTVAANATTGVSSLRVDARPIANDAESLDQALDTTVATQDVTMPTTAYHTKEVSFTLPTTGNGFPVAAKDVLLVRIEHAGADANDTLAAPTLLVRAELEIDLS